MGILKVIVLRGKSLVIRDFRSSDPYVVVKLGKQKAKTRVIRSCLNPVWNEELSFTLTEPAGQLKFEVYDRDCFKPDDKMGHASVKLQPILLATRFRKILRLSAGEIPLRKVVPGSDNCFACESSIVSIDGEVVQEARLRLAGVESGEIEVKIKYIGVEADEREQKHLSCSLA